MARDSREIIDLERNMVKARILGQMGLSMSEVGLKIRYLVVEPILGVMEEGMKAPGWTIICMGRGNIPGKMVELMMENM